MRLLVLVIAVFLTTGCEDEPKNCTSDEECGQGFACRELPSDVRNWPPGKFCTTPPCTTAEDCPDIECPLGGKSCVDGECAYACDE